MHFIFETRFLLFSPPDSSTRENTKIGQYSVNTEDEAITPLYRVDQLLFLSVNHWEVITVRLFGAVGVVGQLRAVFSK